MFSRTFLFITICIVGMPTQGLLVAREIRAIFLQADRTLPETAHIFSEQLSEDIQLPRRILSPPLSIPRGEIEITVLTEAPIDPKNLPQNAQKLRIPKEWSRCILLFLPSTHSTAFPARVIPINASKGEFPLGHTLIFNFSEANISGKFGDKVVNIRSRSRAILPEPREGRGSYRVDIACTLPEYPEPLLIYGTSWVHTPERRQLMFITPPEGRRKVPMITRVRDHELNLSAEVR